MFFIFLISWIILLPCGIYSQDVETSNTSEVITEDNVQSDPESNPVSESDAPVNDSVSSPDFSLFMELRMNFLDSNQKLDDIFRLASFYLSHKVYGKAVELYGIFLNQPIENIKQKALAFYNKALSLYLLKNYESAILDFKSAYAYNNELYDSLRMLGTIYFIQKNKEKAIEFWAKYLNENTIESPERTAIEVIYNQINTPEFTFKTPEAPSSTQSTNWPFLSPETIPYPDAGYQRKRTI